MPEANPIVVANESGELAKEALLMLWRPTDLTVDDVADRLSGLAITSGLYFDVAGPTAACLGSMLSAVNTNAQRLAILSVLEQFSYGEPHRETWDTNRNLERQVKTALKSCENVLLALVGSGNPSVRALALIVAAPVAKTSEWLMWAIESLRSGEHLVEQQAVNTVIDFLNDQ